MLSPICTDFIAGQNDLCLTWSVGFAVWLLNVAPSGVTLKVTSSGSMEPRLHELTLQSELLPMGIDADKLTWCREC